ncbi:hypothetical protein [Dongshaea marina]|uniref:hypothetical protein n=1 Tax=Dongshaea marina TaxID=2047966 RepID=UPI000D3E6F84|nr:hypothetical protein [Dongshaea marina]
MKKISYLILGGIIAATLSGCASHKIAVIPGSLDVIPMTPTEIASGQCKWVGTDTIQKEQPANVYRKLRNDTYQRGGNRYRVTSILSTQGSLPTGLVAELYQCPVASTDSGNTTDSDTSSGTQTGNALIQYIPGAESVQPVRFRADQHCKIVGSSVVRDDNPKNMEVKLANESYMLGGNRYHITKILKTKDAQPVSVISDVYRCKLSDMNME